MADCVKQGFSSMIRHELVRRLALKDHNTILEKRPHKVDGITYLDFEEINLCSARSLAGLWRL